MTCTILLICDMMLVIIVALGIASCDFGQDLEIVVRIDMIVRTQMNLRILGRMFVVLLVLLTLGRDV